MVVQAKENFSFSDSLAAVTCFWATQSFKHYVCSVLLSYSMKWTSNGSDSLKIELTMTKIWVAYRHAMTDSFNPRFASVKSFSTGSCRVYCLTSRRVLHLEAGHDIIESALRGDIFGCHSTCFDTFVIYLSWRYVNANVKSMEYRVLWGLKTLNFNYLILLGLKIKENI